MTKTPSPARSSAVEWGPVDFRYRPESSWTAICHADDPEKTLVREDGALLYGYRRSTWLTYTFDRVIEFRLAGSELPRAVEQRTERADNAIVVTTIRYPRAELVLRTFRHRAASRAFDMVKWEIRVSDGADELLTGLQVELFDRSAHFTSGPTGASARVYAVEDAALAAVEWQYEAHDPTAADWRLSAAEVALRSEPQRLAFAQPSGFRPVYAFATVPELVAGGERLRGTLVVPLDGRDLEQLDEGWSERALELERGYWAGLFPEGLPLRVPDSGIQELLQACARNLLQARERRGDARVFQVGHAVYRDFWIADSFFMLEGVRYLGLDDAAEESLSALDGYVGDDGSILALGHIGHIKETAVAIATVVRQAELAGRLDRLGSWWERIDRAVEHIAALHASTFELAPEAKARGLMPPAFGDGGVAGVRAEYTTMLWSLAGLRIVIAAAAHAGHAGLERYQAVYSDLRADFDRCRRRDTRLLLDGRSYLPMVLDGGEHHTRLDADPVAPENRIRPETATWALAHAIYPGEVFEPDDAVVQDYLHLLELSDDEEHVPATTGWLPYRSLWTYYASFAAHAFLFAGRPEKAVEYLYGFANHAAPTRVWREEQPLRNAGHSIINGDMPHNWASAEFIRLVRNLLVLERGDELVLLPALPASWSQPGSHVQVETPTRFGRVRVDLHAHEARGQIEVGFVPGAVRPARCVLHVPAGEHAIRCGEAELEATGPTLVELRCSDDGRLAFAESVGV
jgi:hypothetical protein